MSVDTVWWVQPLISNAAASTASLVGTASESALPCPLSPVVPRSPVSTERRHQVDVAQAHRTRIAAWIPASPASPLLATGESGGRSDRRGRSAGGRRAAATAPGRGGAVGGDEWAGRGRRHRRGPGTLPASLISHLPSGLCSAWSAQPRVGSIPRRAVRASGGTGGGCRAQGGCRTGDAAGAWIHAGDAAGKPLTPDDAEMRRFCPDPTRVSLGARR